MISALPASAKSNDAFDGMQGSFFSSDTAPEVILQKSFAEELLGKTPTLGAPRTECRRSGEAAAGQRTDHALCAARDQRRRNPRPPSPTLRIQRMTARHVPIPWFRASRNSRLWASPISIRRACAARRGQGLSAAEAGRESARHAAHRLARNFARGQRSAGLFLDQRAGKKPSAGAGCRRCHQENGIQHVLDSRRQPQPADSFSACCTYFSEFSAAWRWPSRRSES